MIRLAAILFLMTRAAFGGAVVEENVEHAGVKFRVVRLAPARVQLVWKDAQGQPYRSFDRVQAALTKQGKTVKFLMNAGIFEPGGIPSGLLIENGIGKDSRPLNLANAPGNFFLKPNGVMRIEATAGKREAFIAPSVSYSHRERDVKVLSSRWLECAIQSGPMLLIDGQRHPAFTEKSTSKLVRNGVGVDGKGQLVFAITAKGEMVNFWDFAGLFLTLGCKNALFLDGTISQMAVNPDKPVQSNQFGAMFIVTE